MCVESTVPQNSSRVGAGGMTLADCMKKLTFSLKTQ